MIFVPQIEIPEGWRATFLGRLACVFGWHFGQIALSFPLISPVLIECCECKKVYNKYVQLEFNK